MMRDLGEVDIRFREMLRRLAPADRLAMACRMFATGRALVVAGLRSQDRDLAGLRLKRALLARTYGRDLDPDHLSRIAASLGQPNKRMEADGGASD